jgi:DNA-binding NarL/FixJ family response regulator
MKPPSTKNQKLRLFLVDDHPLVRERLRKLIEQQPEWTVCGEFGEAAECLRQLPQSKPDLVIVDLSLGKSHGIELIKDIKAQDGGARVLVLSMHDESLFAERALRAGALGYVTKQEPAEVILTAIRRAASGEMYLTERMATQLVGLLLHGPSIFTGSLSGGLSDRELEIFELIGEGQSTRQIAEALRLDVKTVETYRSRIKDKLHLNTSAELLQQAVHWMQSRGKTVTASQPPPTTSRGLSNTR